MSIQHSSLRKQIEIVFNQIKDELCQLSSGIVFMQIRNDGIGKFGVRHDHFDSMSDQSAGNSTGLSEWHWKSFKQMAMDSLKLKKNWTHGEISYEFAMKRGILCTSVQMESNYNMANLINGNHN